MQLAKVHLNKEKKGFITCPSCGATQIIDKSGDNNSHETNNVKCHCGNIYKLVFERKYYRKSVTIPATIRHLDSVTEVYHVLIRSLSVGDVGFKTSHIAKMKTEKIYEIKFSLDDGSNSQICENIVIKCVKGYDIGAEFFDQDTYNYALDFYTMPLVPIVPTRL